MTEKDVKEELLIKSIKETNEECIIKLDETAEWMTKFDAISRTKQYGKVIMAEKQQTIEMFFKQGHILKRFKDTEIFFETIGLNKSTIYVKINIHRLVKKYPRLRNLTLSSNYLKNNFKKIKFVCEKVVMNL